MLRELEAVKSTAGNRPILGIVGAGQLARMMIEAATRLDVEVRVLATSPDDCAASLASAVVLGDHRDAAAVRELAGSCDVITFDHERTPPAVLEAVEASGVVLRPGCEAMVLASDKVMQRRVAAGAGVPVAEHAVVGAPDELREAADRLGLPLVAKASRGGYDGRGVRWLRSAGDVEDLAELISTVRTPWILEPDLEIQTELAVQIVRRPAGETAVYPVVETVQRNGICTTVTVPARTDRRLSDQLVSVAHRLADRLDLVGVLAVEAFVVGGELLLNELAPRPHNSGHHTIDSCVTSQFENHVRAVLDLPLGDTGSIVPAAVMANVIATGPTLAPLHAVPVRDGATIHLYGKQPVAGRKVGHVTVVGSGGPHLEQAAVETAASLTSTGGSVRRSDHRAGAVA